MHEKLCGIRRDSGARDVLILVATVNPHLIRRRLSAGMNRQMNLTGISGFAGGAIGAVIAFAVALLPERIKEREPFARFQSNAIRVLSGITECAVPSHGSRLSLCISV